MAHSEGCYQIKCDASARMLPPERITKIVDKGIKDRGKLQAGQFKTFKSTTTYIR
ncbi:MAG: hypothetical protein KME18_21315 [Phormidium tanganyikae FI6-MK23]|nr:hypothetical protein [Phormidium tanganyikae FI6-MK23]